MRKLPGREILSDCAGLCPEGFLRSTATPHARKLPKAPSSLGAANKRGSSARSPLNHVWRRGEPEALSARSEPLRRAAASISPASSRFRMASAKPDPGTCHRVV